MGGVPVLAVTLGDPAGIGVEVAIKALADAEIFSLARFVVVGDKKVFSRACGLLNIQFQNIRYIEHATLKGTASSVEDCLSFVHVSSDVKPSDTFSAKVDARLGDAAMRYVAAGVGLVQAGAADAVVTAPINKESIMKAGYRYQGHTEYLADLCGVAHPSMMLASGNIRVVLATTHCALKDVPGALTVEKVLLTIQNAHSGARLLGIPSPRIAVCGLNPHAGEGGAFGTEETDIIDPAIRKARGKRIDATGPYPPDTVFYKAHKGMFDVVVCMYHDQGLIPLKMLGFEKGINVTLGLPIVRTSTDHGTAFDIAGKLTADPSSMKEAVKAAAAMVNSRRGEKTDRTSQDIKNKKTADVALLHSPSAIAGYSKEYSFNFKKSRGQNFLSDANVLGKIVKEAVLTGKDIVLEVGTGLGVLTRQLCLVAGKVVSYEIDSRVFEAAQAALAEELAQGNLTLVHKDFMKEAQDELDKLGGPLKIIANIPYSISGRFIVWMEVCGLKIASAVLTVQKEVGERICAGICTKDYSVLSVVCQALSAPRVAFPISRTCFMPVPKVDSCCVAFDSFADHGPEFKRLVLDIAKAAFCARRKTMRKAVLMSTLEDSRKTLVITAAAQCGVPSNARAEEIAPDIYVKIARIIQNATHGARFG